MKAFHTKKRREKDAADYALRADPLHGRTPAEAMRTLRRCRQFAANLNYILDDVLQGADPVWFDPEHAITDRDDDAIIDWRGIAENFTTDGYTTDDAGLLVNMQNDSLKASNRIEAVTTYRDDYMDSGELSHDYMLRKTIHSPFPCDTWGRMPLSIQHWSIIALPMIRSRALWQWEHALNIYAERNGLKLYDRFQFYSIAGWNMTITQRVPARPESDEIWTGPIIYSLSATAAFAPK